MDEEKFKQIILILLRSQKCPFIIEFPNEMRNGIFLENSRDLLIIFAWIIQISGLFEKYHEKYLEKISEELDFKNIQQELELNEIKKSQNPEGHNIIEKKNINENDLIEAYNKIIKKFLRLFKLLEYQEKIKEKFKTELIAQKIPLKINEFYLLKDPKIFQLILERLEKINLSLEKEKEGLKHEELFWLWMESVLDLDKKEISNDPYYGFSDSKDSLSIPNFDASNFKGIECIFGELKELNEKYHFYKEEFKQFQNLWEKKKTQLNEGSDSSKKIDEFKTKSIQILNDFEKKFLSFEKMQMLLKQNTPEVFLSSEIISLFPQEIKKEQKNTNKENENEYFNFINELNAKESMLKEEISQKIKETFTYLKKYFDIYPELS